MSDVDNDQPRKKRRLRTPSETVREKATKAQEAATQEQQPTKKRRLGRLLAAPFRALGWFGHRPPLKQLGHGLRWFFGLRPLRFIGRILGLRYVRDSWRELKIVTWPSRKQSRQLTMAVVIFSVIFGGLIALADFGLNKLFKDILLK